MSCWHAEEALADGRRLWRVPSALAGQFAPGQQLAVAEKQLPILRADNDALYVVAAAAESAASALQLVGSPLVVAEPASLLLVTEDDGLFAALAWLFRHRRKVEPGTLRVLAVFSATLPFRPQPSRYLTPMLPSHVTAALPLLDDWQIVSRIAHPDGLPGCFDGDPGQLIQAWQQAGDRVMTIR